MTYITIDKEKIDPYFIVGVTEDDSEETLYRRYKQKAKILHPDKSKGKDKKLCEKNFRILKESYEYIKKEKRGENKTNDIKKLREAKREKYKEDEAKNFKSKEDKKKFDKKFEKQKEDIKRPEDMGHREHRRMKNVGEYEKLNVEIDRILDKFSNKKFNKIFEYLKLKNKKEDDKEKGLIVKTSDGFYGYNSGTTKQMPVSVYNGLLLTADYSGEDGKGFYGDDYADYLEVLNAIKNPKKGEIDIKKILRQKTKVEEVKRTLQELEKSRSSSDTNIPRGSYVNAIEEFELKKSRQLREEIERSKRLIMKYPEIFGKEMIEQAKRGQLEMSSDTFGDTFDDRIRIEENLTRRGYRRDITY
jgi:curved DNA-binding protein CbpA